MTVIRRRPGAPAKAARRDFRTAGVTVGGTGSPGFQLPYGVAIPNAGLEAASPSGEEVVTALDTPTAIVIRTATGRYSRPFRNPTESIQSAASFGGGYMSDQAILPWDPFAPAIVSVWAQERARGYRVRVFDPHSLKSSQPTSVPDLNVHSHPRVCFLPSGRVLLEIRADSGKNAPSRLLVSDAQRSRFTALDAVRLGTVSSISCDAAASGKVFAATAGTGLVYEVRANTIDGSPLQ
jgi:hypothetical protein